MGMSCNLRMFLCLLLCFEWRCHIDDHRTLTVSLLAQDLGAQPHHPYPSVVQWKGANARSFIHCDDRVCVCARACVRVCVAVREGGGCGWGEQERWYIEWLRWENSIKVWWDKIIIHIGTACTRLWHEGGIRWILYLAVMTRASRDAWKEIQEKKCENGERATLLQHEQQTRWNRNGNSRLKLILRACTKENVAEISSYTQESINNETEPYTESPKILAFSLTWFAVLFHFSIWVWNDLFCMFICFFKIV